MRPPVFAGLKLKTVCCLHKCDPIPIAACRSKYQVRASVMVGKKPGNFVLFKLCYWKTISVFFFSLYLFNHV